LQVEKASIALIQKGSTKSGSIFCKFACTKSQALIIIIFRGGILSFLGSGSLTVLVVILGPQ